MKKFSLLSGLAIATAACAICVPVMAQEAARPTTVDLSTFDCRTLLKMSGEYRDNAILFLHGYISGQKKQTMIDLAPMATSTDKIMDYCIANPSANALAAFGANR